MASIAILTSLYEAGRPYFEDFSAAVVAAAQGHDAMLIAAVDDFRGPKAALARLRQDLPVRLVHAPAGASVARVRRTMLEAGRQSDAEVLVFADMDDALLDHALAAHVDALEDADFSYGDMLLVEDRDPSLARSFFEGASIPLRLEGRQDWRALVPRNFLGFTNTAVRTSCLNDRICTVPAAALAADWWFFSMLLLEDRAGAQAARPVTRYRMHPASTLGGRADPDIAAVAKRVELVRRHYALLPSDPKVADRDAALAALQALLAEEPSALAQEIEAACGASGVWFEDIARVAESQTVRRFAA